MIYGVDYYPEHWDRSEWEHRAELVKSLTACPMDMVHNALKNTLKKFTNCLNSRNNV